MDTVVNLWSLTGMVVIIAGSILRFNPMLVVAVAAIAIGFAASVSIEQTLTMIGTDTIKTWALPLIVLLPLAVVGLPERHGLRGRAQNWITRIQLVTIGRLLIVYLVVHELTVAASLTSLGGRPQMVRPLLASMAEGAAGNYLGRPPASACKRLLAFCAATDNMGLFFGGDIFVTSGVIALTHAFPLGSGIDVEPLCITVWGIPTVVCAFLVHSVHFKRLDGWLAREMGSQWGAAGNTNTITAKQG